jgi:hypothetical protein
MTCRSRHVRCDHVRPRCSPCKKASRQCQYAPLDNTTETDSPQPQAKRANAVGPAPAIRVVFYEPWERKGWTGDQSGGVVGLSDQTRSSHRSLSVGVAPVRPRRRKVSTQGRFKVKLDDFQPPLLSSVPTAPSIHPGQTPKEQRSLQYFRAVVAQYLSGYFSSHFWKNLAFQVAQTVPSLRHGMIAIASHWENVVVPGILSRKMSHWQCDAFALRQYNRAVSEMRSCLEVRNATSQGTVEVLVSCLLFVCLEMAQNHYESACKQLSCGLFLFCEWDRARTKLAEGEAGNERTGTGELESQIAHIFRRLMTQSLLFPVRRMDEKLLVPDLTPRMPAVPERFDTVDEARDSFNDCMSTVLHGVKSRDLPSSVAVAGTSFLKRWSTAFSDLRQQAAKRRDMGEQRNCVLLELQRLAIYLWALSSSFTSEMDFDDWLPEFSQLVTLAKQLIDDKHAAIKNGKVLYYHKFDTGIILPLYLVASRCRDPNLRRQSIHLLDIGPRQEGIWNAEILKCLAERTMQIEETGLEHVESCKDVPLWARVRLEDASLLTSERRIAAVFVRSRGEAKTAGEVLRESIPYSG